MKNDYVVLTELWSFRNIWLMKNSSRNEFLRNSSLLEFFRNYFCEVLRCAVVGKARVSAEIPDIEIPPQNKEQIDELKVSWKESGMRKLV